MSGGAHVCAVPGCHQPATGTIPDVPGGAPAHRWLAQKNRDEPPVTVCLDCGQTTNNYSYACPGPQPARPPIRHCDRHDPTQPVAVAISLARSCRESGIPARTLMAAAVLTGVAEMGQEQLKARVCQLIDTFPDPGIARRLLGVEKQP